MSPRITVPFALRRPWLLARDLLVRRSHPDLERLGSIRSPEAFVWGILPHAARTFSACIAFLPARMAKAAAVAYLYCRSLDTYEDLVPEPAAREEALRGFAGRFDPAGGRVGSEPPPPPLPPMDERLAHDARDRAHILLVNRCALVDEVFLGLAAPVRGIIVELVRGMSEGMVWSSGVFARQGGVLTSGEQLSLYCRNVLGLPTLFAVRLLTLDRTGSPEVSPALREDAMLAGEMIQLANVTRDIEKDLRRGIAYHPALAGDLGRDALGLDPLGGGDAARDAALLERIRGVREDLLARALALAPAYRRMAEAIRFPALSLGRASTVLMLRFTERYYRGCVRRIGREPWGGPRSGLALILASLPCVWSRGAAQRSLRGLERKLVGFAGGGPSGRR